MALSSDAELIVDGGVRYKAQQAGFFSTFGPAFDSHFDADLTTWSLTPRVNFEHGVAGVPATSILGLDIYHATYDPTARSIAAMRPFIAIT